MGFRSSSVALTVGTTALRVLETNPNRVHALLVNDSDTTIYLALGVQAAANKGIRLNASGGAYEINLTNPWDGYVSAYCSASKTLLVNEVEFSAEATQPTEQSAFVPPITQEMVARPGPVLGGVEPYVG